MNKKIASLFVLSSMALAPAAASAQERERWSNPVFLDPSPGNLALCFLDEVAELFCTSTPTPRPQEVAMCAPEGAVMNVRVQEIRIDDNTDKNNINVAGIIFALDVLMEVTDAGSEISNEGLYDAVTDLLEDVADREQFRRIATYGGRVFVTITWDECVDGEWVQHEAQEFQLMPPAGLEHPIGGDDLWRSDYPRQLPQRRRRRQSRRRRPGHRRRRRCRPHRERNLQLIPNQRTPPTARNSERVSALRGRRAARTRAGWAGSA